MHSNPLNQVLLSFIRLHPSRLQIQSLSLNQMIFRKFNFLSPVQKLLHLVVAEWANESIQIQVGCLRRSQVLCILTSERLCKRSHGRKRSKTLENELKSTVFLIIFDHAKACASMRLLIEIHNTQVQICWGPTFSDL